MSLLRTENGLTMDIFVVKHTGRGLVVKRLGVLSKVQMLNLVLGVGVFPFFQFLAKLGAKFLAKFSGLFCWDIRRKRNFSKNLSPKVPRLCAAKLAKIEGKTS